MSEQQNEQRCQQCGKANPPKGFRTVSIIYRGRDDYGRAAVLKKQCTVCADSPCGGHLQMAHEG